MCVYICFVHNVLCTNADVFFYTFRWHNFAPSPCFPRDRFRVSTLSAGFDGELKTNETKHADGPTRRTTTVTWAGGRETTVDRADNTPHNLLWDRLSTWFKTSSNKVRSLLSYGPARLSLARQYRVWFREPQRLYVENFISGFLIVYFIRLYQRPNITKSRRLK